MTRDFGLFDTTRMNDVLKGTIGFDKFFKDLLDVNENLTKLPGYPPYNIKKTADNTYVIELAVSGFGRQDIEITMENNILTVKGNLQSDDANNYIFKGIADRAFTRNFTLADSVEIKNAEMLNGMLKIWLERLIPEEKKPKTIPIT